MSRPPDSRDAIAEFDRRKRFHDDAVAARKAAEVVYADWRGTPYMREVTRHQKRLLVLMAAVGFAVSFAGLLPTKLDALGITLSIPDRALVRWVVGFFVVYFWVEFNSSAVRDHRYWEERLRITHRELVSALQTERAQVRESFQNLSFVQEQERELDGLIQQYQERPKLAGLGRMGYVDYVLPTTLAGVSLLTCVWAIYQAYYAPA